MRNKTLANLILTGATLALLCMPGNPALAKGSSGFSVRVLVDDAPRTEYYHHGAVYVEAVRGASYSLRLTNPTPYRVAVALSVDGLNTLDAKHTDPQNAAKWVLEPCESTVISGWQVSDNVARNFFFTGERHSYGAALGQTENLGVIEAVYFRERRRIARNYEPRPVEGDSARSESAEGGRAQAPAPPSAAAGATNKAKRDAADDFAATGMGQRAEHETELVDFDLDPNPLASVRIRYEFHPQLVKLGILPAVSSTLERREHASGFTAYCPEP
jgi:hypothetical protein